MTRLHEEKQTHDVFFALLSPIFAIDPENIDKASAYTALWEKAIKPRENLAQSHRYKRNGI
ncbi:hypothetical protein DPMN_116219 [Dreissena polymorpha]|uniref:Uncharacterized protein n=1 Tax=Dreissena polymorpha TaxID=45954 RepID=A0A9D4QUJ1_DREPO|nr:hypothetical protein DPMN_116219 [Dreissena polymorpha]